MGEIPFTREQVQTYQRLRDEVFAEHPSEGGWTDLTIHKTGIMTVEVRRFRGAELEIYRVGRDGEVIDHSTL
jgi:hypothetical protein